MSERPHVEFVYEGDRFEIRIHDPKAIAAQLGDTTLAAFYRCFIGADRIVALEHMIVLNNEAQKNPTDLTRADSHAHSRNMRLLAMYLAGTMYELGDALQALCNSKVALKVKDRSSWAPLDKLRAEWNKDAYAGKVRNNFAHHFGEIPDYVTGIAHVDAPTMVVLVEVAERTRHSGNMVEPFNALLRAHGIQDDEMRAFVKKTYEAHTGLPKLLFGFFTEVLESQGIEIRETKI